MTTTLLPAASPADCLFVACEATGRTKSEVFTPYRGAAVVRCRELAVWLMRIATPASFPEIAVEMGRKKTNNGSVIEMFTRAKENERRCIDFHQLCVNGLERLAECRSLTDGAVKWMELERTLAVPQRSGVRRGLAWAGEGSQ